MWDGGFQSHLCFSRAWCLMCGHRSVRFLLENATPVWALEAKQSGRLVGGTALGRLRDSLYSFLGGAPVWSLPDAEVIALAGLSLVSRTLTRNGAPIDGQPSVDERSGLIAFTGGMNVTKSVNWRIRLLGSVRYSFMPRDERAEQEGAGAHIVRAGAGVELRLHR